MGLMDFLKPGRYQRRRGGVPRDARRATDRCAHGGGIRGRPHSRRGERAAAADRRHRERGADKSTPLFVYCMSGARSQQAVGALKQMGYTDARNIGGIGSWRGDVER